MNDFLSWGLPLGRITGIQVRIHWTLILFWAAQLPERVNVQTSRSWAVLAWAVSAGLMLLCILLHELGHCYAARSQGGNADEILLWPLGGLAFCRCPDFWKSHLIVAAGGPAISAAIAGVSYTAFYLFERYIGFNPWPMTLGKVLYHQAEAILVGWNVIILIFNLIPLYPMDGGRILHAGLWGFFSRRGGYAWGGYSRASRITLMVSRVAGIAGLAYAVWNEDYMLAGIFLWALMYAESLRGTDG